MKKYLFLLGLLLVACGKDNGAGQNNSANVKAAQAARANLGMLTISWGDKTKSTVVRNFHSQTKGVALDGAFTLPVDSKAMSVGFSFPEAYSVFTEANFQRVGGAQFSPKLRNEKSAGEIDLAQIRNELELSENKIGLMQLKNKDGVEFSVALRALPNSLPMEFLGLGGRTDSLVNDGIPLDLIERLSVKNPYSYPLEIYLPNGMEALLSRAVTSFAIVSEPYQMIFGEVCPGAIYRSNNSKRKDSQNTKLFFGGMGNSKVLIPAGETKIINVYAQSAMAHEFALHGASYGGTFHSMVSLPAKRVGWGGSPTDPGSVSCGTIQNLDLPNGDWFERPVLQFPGGLKFQLRYGDLAPEQDPINREFNMGVDSIGVF